ncbi:uncharacterized protein LOC106659350 [Trichogramma pretiosum]|uniref:uncharacterized protein LOC106659350 n=1 Tax=Trichogramma pretiosum TaxID=7493 RepID=UPI0006C95242|nr:uncharacterized protein LOC106659350 [Trichogramma pretiosum]
MGLSCGKESFNVDKSTKFTSQSQGFYRSFENLSYWDRVNPINGKKTVQQLDEESDSVASASTIPVNGSNGAKNNLSLVDSKDNNDEDEIKQANDSVIEEYKEK